MKKTLITLIVLLFSILANAENVITVKYADKDSSSLYLDYYKADKCTDNGYTIVYIFGGGFVGWVRNDPKWVPYYESLATAGYNVASIDYRLYLKGKKVKGLGIKLMEKAINTATEDLFSAVSFLIENGKELDVDSEKIILIGSSAGAITALQADYQLSNRAKSSIILPGDFRFAGIVSFAGGIFSREGRVNYRVSNPSPTFFLHGIDDKLVKYNKTQFANIGFFGSKALVKRFDKFEYPYFIIRVKDLGHEVAGGMIKALDRTLWFMNTFIIEGKWLQIDETYYDPSIQKSEVGSFKPSDLYKLPDAPK